MTNWHTSETVQRGGLPAVQGLVPEFKSTVEGTNTQNCPLTFIYIQPHIPVQVHMYVWQTDRHISYT